MMYGGNHSFLSWVVISLLNSSAVLVPLVSLLRRSGVILANDWLFVVSAISYVAGKFFKTFVDLDRGRVDAHGDACVP